MRVGDSPMLPTRVLLNTEGHGSAPHLVPDEPIDTIFVRDDGWSLGARKALAAEAQRLWQGKWIERWDWRDGAWVKTWPLQEERA